MSVSILLSGALFRQPQQKISQSGKRYMSGTIKAAAADNTSADFWNLLVFSDTAQAELARLGDGDKVAVQGTLKIELYEREGQQRISRTVFADHVLALRAAPKERKPKAPPVGSKAADLPVKQSILPSTDPALDDDIPF